MTGKANWNTTSLCKKSLATILREAYKDASRDDLCIVKGIESATGKSYEIDFEELMNGKDTIQKAVERCNSET